MINKSLILVTLIFSSYLIFAQQDLKSNVDANLLHSISTLDQMMQNNDPKITLILADDITFGHSNGWIQSLDDFKKDIESKKIHYKIIQQKVLKEIKFRKNLASLRRIINVSGQYEQYHFMMDLSVLEIWIKEKSIWKLWSRQSIEIKS